MRDESEMVEISYRDVVEIAGASNVDGTKFHLYRDEHGDLVATFYPSGGGYEIAAGIEENSHTNRARITLTFDYDAGLESPKDWDWYLMVDDIHNVVVESYRDIPRKRG